MRSENKIRESRAHCCNGLTEMAATSALGEEYVTFFSYYLRFLLDLKSLVDIIDLLKKCGFPESRWHELGLRLGLHKNALDAIETNHPRDVSRCLTECLSQWLRRADDVDSRGGATYDSLSTALRSMNENAVADKLDKKSELCINHYSTLWGL